MDIGGGDSMEGGEKSPESGNEHLNQSDHNHQNSMSSRTVKKISVLFLAVTIPCLILYSSADHFQDFFLGSFYNPLPTTQEYSTQANQSSPHINPNISSAAGNLSSKTQDSDHNHSDSPVYSDIPVNVSSQNSTLGTNFSSSVIHQENKEENKLERVLKKAANANRTVIITALNAAWTQPNSVFDLFLESFKIGDQTKPLLDHLVVVALDQKAYSRCLQSHRHCYALSTEGVDFTGQAHYMSKHYMKMMWRRLDFLRVVLETGYNFIFTDTDIMWFRNPFPRFYLGTDFQIACDRYLSDSTNLQNWPNGGFKYVQSNNRTVQFYKFWYAKKFTYPTKNEQDVLNIIKFDPFIKKIGLSIRFLDTAHFGGFCEPSKDLNLVCTMHANCCIGLEKKIHDLKMLIVDWKKYMELPIDRRISNPPSWSGPRNC